MVDIRTYEYIYNILVLAFNTGEHIKTVAGRESNLNPEQAALSDFEVMHLPLQ